MAGVLDIIVVVDAQMVKGGNVAQYVHSISVIVISEDGRVLCVGPYVVRVAGSCVI